MIKIGLENKLFGEIELKLPDGIVKDRVVYLLKWYSKKARRYKFFTYMATILSILLPAILALLNSPALDDCLPAGYIKKLQIILPVLSSAGAAFYAFVQSKDNWIRYRMAVEQIKYETIHYIAKYGNKNPVDVNAEESFLEAIEKICVGELMEWQRNRVETVFGTKKEITSEKNLH